MSELLTFPVLISLGGFLITIGTLIFKAGGDKAKNDATSDSIKKIISNFEEYKKEQKDVIDLLNTRINDLKRIDEVDNKVEDVKEKFGKHEDNQNERDRQVFQLLVDIQKSIGSLEGKICK